MWFGSIRALPYLIERVPIGSNTPILPSQLFSSASGARRLSASTVDSSSYQLAVCRRFSILWQRSGWEVGSCSIRFQVPSSGVNAMCRSRKNHMWVYPLRATLNFVTWLESLLTWRAHINRLHFPRNIMAIYNAIHNCIFYTVCPFGAVFNAHLWVIALLMISSSFANTNLQRFQKMAFSSKWDMPLFGPRQTFALVWCQTNVFGFVFEMPIHRNVSFHRIHNGFFRCICIGWIHFPQSCQCGPTPMDRTLCSRRICQ